jgi:hypothetical protein
MATIHSPASALAVTATTGWVSAKRVEFRGADAVELAGKQHPRRANGLRMRSLALSKTPRTWRSPLYRNWEISPVSGEARRTGS